MSLCFGGYLNVLENMSLITKAGFKGEVTDEGKVNESTWIELGDQVRKNLESGYIALIDAKYVRQLKGELTKHLYPFLSYRFWLAAQRGRDWVFLNKGTKSPIGILQERNWAKHTVKKAARNF